MKKTVYLNGEIVSKIDTNINLQQLYLATPWVEAKYQLCNKRHELIAEFDQDYIRPIAMKRGHLFRLFDTYVADSQRYYIFEEV